MRITITDSLQGESLVTKSNRSAALNSILSGFSLAPANLSFLTNLGVTGTLMASELPDVFDQFIFDSVEDTLINSSSNSGKGLLSYQRDKTLDYQLRKQSDRLTSKEVWVLDPTGSSFVISSFSGVLRPLFLTGAFHANRTSVYLVGYSFPKEHLEMKNEWPQKTQQMIRSYLDDSVPLSITVDRTSIGLVPQSIRVLTKSGGVTLPLPEPNYRVFIPVNSISQLYVTYEKATDQIMPSSSGYLSTGIDPNYLALESSRYKLGITFASGYLFMRIGAKDPQYNFNYQNLDGSLGGSGYSSSLSGPGITGFVNATPNYLIGTINEFRQSSFIGENGATSIYIVNASVIVELADTRQFHMTASVVSTRQN